MYNLIERAKRKKNRKGFTLIELIVVIVIIGILAAIVIPRLSGFTETANEKAALSDARTILTALSTMYAQAPSATADAAVAGTLIDDADLVALTGPLNGTFTAAVTCVNGDIGFTYTSTAGNIPVVVTDGEVVSVNGEAI